MKYLKLVCGFLLVVLFVGMSVALAGTRTEVVRPGEEKIWAGMKRGDVLKVYCRPQGMLLKYFFASRTVNLANVASYRAGSKRKPAGFKEIKGLRGGMSVSVNVFCAPGSEGPWRWLQCMVEQTPTEQNLETEKEIGYVPAVYLFEIRCYQGSEAYGRSCATWAGFRPILAFKVSPQFDFVPAAAAEENIKDSITKGQNSQKQPERTLEQRACSIRAFAASAKKLALISRIDPEDRASKEMKRYKLVGSSLNCGPSALEPFIGCVRTFAVSAKTEPELAEPANAVIQQTRIVDSYLRVNYERLCKLCASNNNKTQESLYLRQKKYLAEMKPFMGRLAQALEKLSETGQFSITKLVVSK